MKCPGQHVLACFHPAPLLHLPGPGIKRWAKGAYGNPHLKSSCSWISPLLKLTEGSLMMGFTGRGGGYEEFIQQIFNTALLRFFCFVGLLVCF